MGIRRLSMMAALLCGFAGAAEAAAADPQPLTLGPVTVGALLQGWYVSDQRPGAKDGFQLRRMEVKLAGPIHPQARWFLVIDPAKPVNIKTAAQGGALTAAQADPKSLILKDAALVLDAGDRLPGVSLTAGQFKPPFGMEGTGSSSRLDLVERSAMSAVFGWSDYRDLGAMMTATRASWSVFLGVFNGDGPNTTDTNEDKDLTGRVVLIPTEHVHLGLAGSLGRTTAARLLDERWGLEAAWTPAPWSLKAEVAQGHGSTGETASTGRATAYGALGYFFTPRVQGVARFDWWEPDTTKGGDIQKEVTAGLNYLVDGHRFKFQTSYSLRQEERPSVANDVFRFAAQVSF